MINDIEDLLEKYGCELICFDYNEKVFGNIVLEIKYKNQKLTFITDRGEIYCNGEFLLDGEYFRSENKSTSQKLFELIEIKLTLQKK